MKGGTQPWGGIVPNVAEVPGHGAAAEFAAVEPVADPMLEREPVAGPPTESAAQLLAQQELVTRLSRLEAHIARQNEPPQWRVFTFKPATLIHRDQVGGFARAYGIVNPTACKIYLGLSGERPQPGQHSFVLGARMAVVLPIGIDAVEVGCDPTDLGAEEATIWRMRFETCQPFFLGSM